MNLNEIISAAQEGLDVLRWTGLVEPQVLTIRHGRVSWYKTVAREGHPSPGNATKRMPPINMSSEKADQWRKQQKSAYSHPVDIRCWRESDREVKTFPSDIRQSELLAACKIIAEQLFGDEIVEVEICRSIKPSIMGVCAYELPDGRLIRNGDSDADQFPLSEVVFLRNGRTCWEEYPREGTVSAQPDFEGKLGFVVDEGEVERLRENEI